MADEDVCFTCSNNERLDLPPRERIYVGPGWRVAHAFGTALPGWLVLLPRRQVTALDELTAAEAEELGPLLRLVTCALRETTGCDKTYVALFAEAEGFAHVHFHVVPRHGDLDPGLRGPRVFNLLGSDPDRSIPDAAMDEIALRIAAALIARRETTGRPVTDMEAGALSPRWGAYARRLPLSLEDPRGPAAGEVELPLHVAWSGRRVYDVGQEDQRLVLYALLLAEAQREDLERLVHRESPVSMWPRLRRLLGPHARREWERQLITSASR